MNDEELRMDAYYYGFDRTGVIEVDRILSAVARAGKAYHGTDQWGEDAYGDGTPVEWIQDAANEAAEHVRAIRSATRETVIRECAETVENLSGQQFGVMRHSYITPYAAASAIRALGREGQ